MNVYDLVFCLLIVLINLDKDRDKELEVCNNFNKNKIFSTQNVITNKVKCFQFFVLVTNFSRKGEGLNED